MDRKLTRVAIDADVIEFAKRGRKWQFLRHDFLFRLSKIWSRGRDPLSRFKV